MPWQRLTRSIGCISKEQIKQLLEERTDQDGLTETGIKGVRMFRATQAIPCVPAVYEPSVVEILSGSKEAILDGHRFVYDESQYLCCPMSMPVKAGPSTASTDKPLYGVIVSLEKRLMTEMAMEMESSGGVLPVELCPKVGDGVIRRLG